MCDQSKYMILSYSESSTSALLHFVKDEHSFDRLYFRDQEFSLLTIAWNVGPSQKVYIDEQEYEFPSHSILPLMVSDSFKFESPQDIIAWQFNKDFYCVIDHDQEVSCVGFIFYGNDRNMFIKLDENHQRKIGNLVQTFEDEFEEKDIQGEMMRMLLKRLIILVTRLGKVQYLSNQIDDYESDTIRSFNLLVEQHYREYHQVQDYAGLMNKSPKTLSNLFSKNSGPSPLQVIKERIIQEAKRLLQYTDHTTKEIAYDLGFDDPASFSRFFKNNVGESPTAYKKEVL